MSDLSGVKVGDVLAHDSGWSGVGLTTVEKVTKTLIICGAGRFNRERGWQAGTSSSYSRRRIWKPTPEDMLRVRILWAQRRIDQLKVEANNVDAVEAMLAAVKPARGSLEDAAK